MLFLALFAATLEHVLYSTDGAVFTERPDGRGTRHYVAVFKDTERVYGVEEVNLRNFMVTRRNPVTERTDRLLVDEIIVLEEW